MSVDQVDDATISGFRESFRYEDHPGSWQPAVRVKEQDRDGVEAEVLFSSWARIFYVLTDAAFQRACFRSYNFWLHDFCQQSPKRLNRHSTALDYRSRASREGYPRVRQDGFQRRAIPPGIKGDAYYNPIYQPIWNAAEETGMLMVIHSGQLKAARRAVGLKNSTAPTSGRVSFSTRARR
jgi:predicted TIM-barrel fold metal-dependent hydrolase